MASANNGNITLNWNMVEGSSNSISDNYQIYWKKGTGAWQNTNVNTKGYNYSETNPSVTFPYPEVDAGEGDYQFLVARGKFIYSNTTFNSVSSVIKIATNKIQPTSINANLQSDNTTILIEWGTDGGRTGSAFRYRIYRKTGNNSFVSIATVTTDIKEYIDNNVVGCTPYLYEVRAFDGTNEYATIATTQAIVRPLSNAGSISDLFISKGFYNDRVNISWKVSAGAGFNRFSIMRKIKNLPNAAEQQIYEVVSSGLTQYSFDDVNATAGTYYDYRVVAWTDCSGEVNEGGSLVSTGFKQPYGVVSGKVSYGTNDVAVEGVNIIAVGESEYANKSLEFTRTANTGIKTPYNTGALSNSAFTFQTWVMVNDATSNIQSLMDAAGKYAVEIDGSNVWLSVYKGNDTQYDEYTFSDAPFQRGVYKHISVTYQRSGSTGTAILYLDGLAVDTVVKAGVTAYTFPTASAADKLIYFGRYWETNNSNNLNGYMDEIRLWERAVTATEIKNNYNAYLSGRETGLKLYYRLDEQSGDEVFDISKQNGVFNENHGALIYNGGVNMRSNVTPTTEQLSIRTVTDSNGAYILNTIPYTGDGSLFTIVPSFENHSFNPTNRPLYFNQQSASYSNVNFTDVSSFMVRGR
ncbi:MAG: LamG domain-containing protein, partial [Paludibacter sp.]|nr:LamG domain-containing protein [Paludibacter sp.]